MPGRRLQTHRAEPVMRRNKRLWCRESRVSKRARSLFDATKNVGPIDLVKLTRIVMAPVLHQMEAGIFMQVFNERGVTSQRGYRWCGAVHPEQESFGPAIGHGRIRAHAGDDREVHRQFALEEWPVKLL